MIFYRIGRPLQNPAFTDETPEKYRELQHGEYTIQNLADISG